MHAKGKLSYAPASLVAAAGLFAGVLASPDLVLARLTERIRSRLSSPTGTEPV